MISKTWPIAMKRACRAVLVCAALMLIPTFGTDPSAAQTKLPHVGVLVVNPMQSAEVQQWFAPFRQTLRERGWIEGQNVIFEYRDGAGDPTRLTEPAAELVRDKVDVLFAVGPPPRCALPSRRR